MQGEPVQHLAGRAPEVVTARGMGQSWTCRDLSDGDVGAVHDPSENGDGGEWTLVLAGRAPVMVSTRNIFFYFPVGGSAQMGTQAEYSSTLLCCFQFG